MRISSFSSAFLFGLTAAATIAAAQDRATSQNQDVVQEVIVTGSRIIRTNLEAPTPVTTLDIGEIRSSGVTSIGDVLSDLPALRGTFTTANSTRFIGTAGVNHLDLRGLGQERTLVLVNGRRHVSASEGNLDVDTNAIPTDLVERVDIVTGGASSIYGSDAVAGVVNFVLKQNFEGFTVNAQSGLSSRGDNANSFFAATGGKNFREGDGNVAVSLEWSKEEGYQASDRPTTRRRGVFIQTQQDPSGVSSDGIPDRNFFDDIHSVHLTEGGVFIPSFQPGVTTSNLPVGPRSRPENSQPRVFAFASDGTLAEIDYGTRDFRPFSATTLGGGGTTLRRYGDLSPDIERASINAIGHLDFTDALQLFGEAKYVRADTFTLSSPSFNQTTNTQLAPTSGSGGLTIALDNPYLTDQARALITPMLRPGATFFYLNRNNLDLGLRGEDTTRETSRFVTGLKGALTDDLRYEVSLNYGQTRIHTNVIGNRLERELRLAVDAARAANGEIVCRSRLNAAGVVVVTGDPIVDACIPVNLLGEGNVTNSARAYITSPSTFDANIKQQVATGFVSYETGSWLNLPGGPIGTALGAEYRKESSDSHYSNDVASGRTFLNAIQAIDKEYSVKEAFAELRLPILAEVPAFHELTLNGSYRIADYTLPNTSSIEAWNGGLEWAPVQDVRFRVNISQSVRAPTLEDLYQPLTQNFASGIRDPCDVNFISQGSPNRPINCAAAGIPAGFINNVARSQSVEFRTSGNPDLIEEKSRSLTLGTVLRPRFAPNLAITVDYFDIEIEDVINTVPVQNILDNCYDATSLDNIYCPLIFRDPATSLFYLAGAGPIGGGVQQITLNYAARKARGIDAEVAYNFAIPSIGDFKARLLGTYVRQRDNFPLLNEPDRPDQIRQELGDPEYAANFDLAFNRGPLTLDYGLRWLDTQYVDFIENIKWVGGRAPVNTDFSDIAFTGSVSYHDLRASYDFRDNLNIYLGVDNITDKLPPLGFTGAGAGSSIYSSRGRFFYGGLKWKLGPGN